MGATGAGGLIRVFLSVAGPDRPWARWVGHQLLRAGFDVEYDEWEWPAGSSFVSRMEAALASADRMVAIVSPHYFDPGTFGREEREAALRLAHGRDGFLVPVRVGECDLPPLFGRLSYIDLVDCVEADAIARLVAGLRGPHLPDPEDRMPWPGKVMGSSPEVSSGEPVRFPGASPISTTNTQATPLPSAGPATPSPGASVARDPSRWDGAAGHSEATPSVPTEPATPVHEAASPSDTMASASSPPTARVANPQRRPPDPLPGADPGSASTSPPRREPSPELRRAADGLAATVLEQWERELELRRVWDPRPLPVTWAEADQDLVERWDHITMTLRTMDAGGRSEDRPALVPPRLAGSGDDIASVFRALPTRRLVILGSPGSGKSILLGRLAVDLLTDYKPGDAVPVIVPAASWSPATQDLWSWLTARLVTAYPGLDRPMPGQRFVRPRRRVRQVDALLHANLLLPIIDGLDEIPGRMQAKAIAAINDALQRRRDIGLVASCRVSPFRDALSAAPKLRNAFGIMLHDLDPAAVRDYLEHDAGDDRWASVIPLLGGNSPVARALSVPLYVSLARTIYNPHVGNIDDGGAAKPGGPADLAGPAERVDVRHRAGPPDPRELLDEHLQTEDDVKGQLFRAFIPAAYRRPSASRGGDTRVGVLTGLRRGSRPYTAEQAEKWLIYLAGHLAKNLGGQTDLNWWDIPRAAPRPLSGAVIGAVSGLAAGIVAFSDPQIGIGIGVGMFVALAVALPVRLLGDRRQQGGVRMGRTLASSLVYGVFGGLVGGVLGGAAGLIGIGTAPRLLGAMAGTAAIGLAVGPSGGRIGGALGGLAGGCTEALTTGIGQGGLVIGLVDGLAIALGVGFAVGLGKADEPSEKLHLSSVGLVGGCAAGTAFGLGTYFGFGAGLVNGLAAGVAVGVAVSVATGLRGMAPRDLTLAAGPQTLFARDRITFVVVTGVYGVTMVVGTYLPEGYDVSLGSTVAGALAIALTGGLLQSCWGTVAITRTWLALRGHLPWNLMAFLADAHERRGVLRQAGAHYQYRHAEFQRYLATHAED